MKFFQKSGLLLLGITFLLIGCLSDESKDSVVTSSIMMNSSSSANVVYGELVDSRDNQVYKTVVIGTQTWMAQNLNYGTYISDGNSGSTYQSGAQKFCYSNIESNCVTDGGLYQWHTVMGFASNCVTTSCASQINKGNHQGICPVGWHVPKDMEWNALEAYLGGSSVAGSKMKLNNTGYTSWNTSINNNGNFSGFSGLPAGFRFHIGGFAGRGDLAYFWVAAEGNAANSYFRNLYSGYSDLGGYYEYTAHGYSLRCVKD